MRDGSTAGIRGNVEVIVGTELFSKGETTAETPRPTREGSAEVILGIMGHGRTVFIFEA